MKKKMSDFHFFLGLILPLILPVVIVAADYSFMFDSFGKESTFGFMYELPLVSNLLRYSSEPYLFISIFITNICILPLSMLYWWLVMPKDFEAKARNIGWLKLVAIIFGSIFLCMILISVWFIGVDKLSHRKHIAFVNTLTNPVLFYLLILVPMYLCALSISASIKLVCFKFLSLFKR